MTDSTTRQELEFSIVGSLILRGDRVGQYLPDLSADDFESDLTRSIFLAIRKMYNRSQLIDRLSVSTELGESYEEAINEAMRWGSADAGAYIPLLKKKAFFAAVRNCATALSFAEQPEEVGKILDELNALNVTRKDRQAVSVGAAVQSFFDRHSGKAPTYIKWGFDTLDAHLFTEPGDFIAIGGYPSAGKTLLAEQFALNFAKQGKRVGFFSFETSEAKLTDRLMAHAAQISFEHIHKNSFNEKEMRAAVNAAYTLSELDLDFIQASGMTVTDIQSFSLAKHYDIVFIDYLQLMANDDRKTRFEAVTAISIALHSMAQSTGITVIALAQLSRADKNKDGKPTPPNMASFRESGQIEQDVDVAMLLYPENLNDNRSNRILKIGKNKDGERATVTLAFDGEHQTMRPVRQDAPPKPPPPKKIPGQQEFEEIDEDEAGPLPF